MRYGRVPGALARIKACSREHDGLKIHAGRTVIEQGAGEVAWRGPPIVW